MDIYKKGLLGPVKGKIGNLVGSNWRDIDFLRSLPSKSNKPASEKQLAQRLKFTMAVEFLGELRDIIRFFPKSKKKTRRSDFNEAMTIVMNNMEGTYPDFIIPYKAVVFTKGPLMNILPKAELVNNQELKLSWSPRLGHGAAENDVVNVIIYSELSEGFSIFNNITRKDAEYSLFSEEVGEGLIHVWTFVCESNETEFSDSKYLGAFKMVD